MHPDISATPRTFVYENEALIDASVGEKSMANRRGWTYDKVSGYKKRSVWFDETPRQSKDYGTGKSRFNLAETRRIVSEFKKFLNWTKENPNPANKDGIWTVAFLSFYKGQTKRLMEELSPISRRRGLYSWFRLRDHNVMADICTVDKFQGHEADLVFLSFVNARDSRGRRRIGFLDNPNRLNVGITRALFQLVMVGDKKNFARCNSELLEALAQTTPAENISWRD
jgi:superfamily I DNA and/or RNA helicase